MNNPMQMLMSVMSGGNMNPMQIMNMFGGNPMFQQAQKMLQGKNTNEMQQIIMNVAKSKGIDENQLKQMASQFNIKL